MNIEHINTLLDGSGIRIIGEYTHLKASERWVDVVITGPDSADEWWEGPIPYQDQRAQLELSADQEVADYLKSIKNQFEPCSVLEWKGNEQRHWNENFSRAKVTTGFFEKLLSMDWVYGDDFPLNPDGRVNRNPQRRIQDIKDKGYTVVFKEGKDGEDSKMILVPLPRRDAHIYESISRKLRVRILAVLTPENVYDLSGGNRAGLIPDHKFPEMRWDENTPRGNSDDMSENQIRAKFQLLDNRRNLQKREVCRQCFQSGDRGTLFGIKFFYKGGPQWNDDIPRSGNKAERGCVGCGWYDIRAWRQALNSQLGEKPEP